MDINEFTMAVLYRMTTVIIAGWIVYMGYRLFRTGVFERASDLKASWGDRYLEIKQAAPGTLFALFGAIILGVSIHKGVSFEERERSTVSSGADPIALLTEAYPEEMMELIFALARGEKLSEEERERVLNWAYERTSKVTAENVDELLRHEYES